ncbi:MAG: DUF2007 domain-containing protein [Pseudomonadota bacterium]
MKELLRTNDPVLISFVEALLSEAGIGCLVLDQNMSVLEGSIGVIPRRVLVEGDRLAEAQALMRDAGVGEEVPGNA